MGGGEGAAEVLIEDLFSEKAVIVCAIEDKNI